MNNIDISESPITNVRVWKKASYPRLITITLHRKSGYSNTIPLSLEEAIDLNRALAKMILEKIDALDK